MEFRHAGYEHLERALVLCVKLARKRRADWDEQLRGDYRRLAAALKTIYGQIASLEAAALKGVAADREHPGYLITVVDGVQLRVPFHLFEALPPKDLLKELVEIAAAVRTDDSSTICISGSCASYSQFGVVSDVDFCEYVDASGRRQPLSEAIERLEAIDSDGLVCFGVHLFEIRYNLGDDRNEVVKHQPSFRPWSTLPSTDPSLTALLPVARKAKFDFLAKTRTEGSIVVTNVAMIVDGRGDYILLESHAGQELPLFDGSFVPRELAEPVALGRYVDYLCNQVDSTLAEKRLAKAAKRAHSLARLLTRNYDADSIVNSMRANDFFIDAAIAARLEIARHIESLSDRALRDRLAGSMVETLKLLCSRASNGPLAGLIERGKDLDDLPFWINNLDQYMQTRTARVDAIEADLREFVEGVREQIATAGA